MTGTAGVLIRLVRRLERGCDAVGAMSVARRWMNCVDLMPSSEVCTSEVAGSCCRLRVSLSAARSLFMGCEACI